MAMATPTPSRRPRHWPAAITLCVLLPACGGGGEGADSSAPGPVSPAVLGAAPLVSAGPSGAVGGQGPEAAAGDRELVPAPPETVDATRTGAFQVKALAGLDDGGHVLVWMAREGGDPPAAWSVWVQRFDAQGRKAGAPARLAYPDALASPEEVAVAALPEGRIGLVVLTDRIEDVAFAITELRYWPFNLEGLIDGEVRVLDAERYARFSPRFARLAGPVTAAAGRDGSQFVAWRYQLVGAAPLAPSVRAQRLAADGEPLGWIQRLDGAGTFSRVFGLRLTPIDEGGWVVALERASGTGARLVNFVQLDVPRPLAFQQALHPADAFLLDLRGHGSLLFTRHLDPDTGEFGERQSVHFTRRGQAQAPRPLARWPVAAVALGGGDYVAFEPAGEGLVAQRYTPAGDPVGAPWPVEATPGLLAAGLRRGALVLAWVAGTPEGQVQVLSQRLSPARPEAGP